MVSVDKFTAVKMYDLVQLHWKAEIKNLVGQIGKSSNDLEKIRLKKVLEFMRGTEMAVVISIENSTAETDKFIKQGLAIQPHRDRLNNLDQAGHDTEYQFKDPDHPLRLVFVCAMWLTGFDVPSLSTLYLDKPMQGHTLMQAIARANRVSSDQINNVNKLNGEIIDYYNVFCNMKRALADYALGDARQPDGTDTNSPIQDKSNLFILLDEAIAQGLAFCQELHIDLESLLDDRANIDNVSLKISDLLDQSIVADNQGFKTKDYRAAYKIVQTGKIWNLSKINFDQLRTEFCNVTHKNLEIADLRSFLEDKLNQMLQQNTARTDFAQRLAAIVQQYNAGGAATESYYEALLEFAENLQQESERHIREGLTEDELELFDLLKKSKMTAEETQKVKLASKSLLTRLQATQPKVLVQDWYKNDQSKRHVKSTVEHVLDGELPDSYDRALFTDKCNKTFDLIYSQASAGQKWVG